MENQRKEEVYRRVQSRTLQLRRLQSRTFAIQPPQLMFAPATANIPYVALDKNIIKRCIRKMYTYTNTNELVTYRKYFVNRAFKADGDRYKFYQPFIGFYVKHVNESRRLYNVIFREEDTGSLVWTHISNAFYEIKLPYLDQVRNYKSIPSLQNLCKATISTRETYLFKKYYS